MILNNNISFLALFILEPVTEPAPKTTGKYVPPSMRMGGAATMTPQPLVQRKKKTAPNLTSEEDFPTLGHR